MKRYAIQTLTSTHTRYLVIYTHGVTSTEHATMREAAAAVRATMGWTDVATSDAFAVGSREGTRGSVYGVECFASQDACDAAADGDAYAPRILICKGDEAWAMGRGEEVSS